MTQCLFVAMHAQPWLRQRHIMEKMECSMPLQE